MSDLAVLERPSQASARKWRIGLHDAMCDPEFFGRVFAAPTFWTWKTVAKIVDGLALDEREAELFRKCTGRERLPDKPVSRITLLVGRRGGKDRFLSAVGVHQTTLARDWKDTLSAGESAVAILIGADKKQSRILRNYCEGLLRAPLLASEVSRMTNEAIEFQSGASSLEIITNDASLVRGRSAVATLATETSFWRTDDGSASSDEGAALPSLSMTPGGGLAIFASSVYRRVGLMGRKWREHHGNDESNELCWLASSAVMNEALPSEVVEAALAEDAQRARAEYLSIWREDISDLFSVSDIESCTDFEITERPYEAGVHYSAFCDPAGGTGRDSAVLAIGHVDNRTKKLIVDAIRERKPRFVPSAVVEEFANLCKSYRISSVCGDRYASGFHSFEWQKNGFRYEESERTRSELYLATLPLIMSERCRLLDHAELRKQFVGLERRIHISGRESVDHGTSASSRDDLSNAVSGLLVRLASTPGLVRITAEMARIFDKPIPLAWADGQVTRFDDYRY